MSEEYREAPNDEAGGHGCKSLCVVLDTNFWDRNTMLRTPMGVALLFALGQANASLGLPEIIEHEHTEHCVDRGLELVAGIEKALGDLRQIAGSTPYVQLPTGVALRHAVKARLNELGSRIIRVPLSEAHAIAALRRVLEKTPPNGPKNQQAKDSAIWEALLELAQTHRVYFVTNDGGFFQNPKDRVDLAKNLADEIVEASLDVRIFCELTDALKALEGIQQPIDKEAIARSLKDALDSMLSAQAERHRFFLGGQLGYDITVFPMETPDRLVTSFILRYQVKPLDREVEDFLDQLIVEGQGYVSQQSLSAMRDDQGKPEVYPGTVRYVRADGEVEPSKSAQYAYPGSMLLAMLSIGTFRL